MRKRRAQLRGRDRWFLGVVAANLLCIGGFLAGGGGPHAEQSPGWRRIDLDRLMPRLESGELQSREALWYEPVAEDAKRR